MTLVAYVLLLDLVCPAEFGELVWLEEAEVAWGVLSWPEEAEVAWLASPQFEAQLGFVLVSLLLVVPSCPAHQNRERNRWKHTHTHARSYTQSIIRQIR